MHIPDHLTPLTPPRPQPRRSPDTPGPEPIDFATVDTPQEAALLPALNGASLTVMMATLEAQARWNVVVTSLQQSQFDERTGGSVRCQGTSSTTSEVSLSGTGSLGEVPVEETWTLHKDNGVLTIEGRIGDSHESLVLHAGDEGTQVLEGQIGEVAVHEVLRRTPGLLLVDGTLNGSEHHQAIEINENAMPLRPPLVIGDVIKVNGSLGDAPITLQVDAICPPQIPAVTYEQHGSIGGVQVEAKHTLQISALPSP